jgi:hypothetical protein
VPIAQQQEQKQDNLIEKWAKDLNRHFPKDEKISFYSICHSFKGYCLNLFWAAIMKDHKQAII